MARAVKGMCLFSAAELGVLQLHLSGGEPTVRRDLEEIVAQAAKVGLYSNLITAGVLLTRARLEALADLGLDHVQLSIQDARAANADRIAHYQGGHAKKLEVAGWVRELGPAAHHQRADASPEHRQPAGHHRSAPSSSARGGSRWRTCNTTAGRCKNREALMPTREQVLRSAELVEEARERLKGILVIDFVVPDYYASRPKPCMGGWGRGIINITPSGKVLPCHAAETIPGLAFDNVRDKPLRDIWLHVRGLPDISAAPPGCRSPAARCEFREVDWGGCRCQAFAFAGDAALTDPACGKSSLHDAFALVAEREAALPPLELVFRNPRAGTQL